MCEQTAVVYNDGDVVWVKLGICWWPGEVISFEKLPADILLSFKKAPLAIVKFFNEEKYEYVKQFSHISSYNSSRKYDFLKKGMDLYRAKHSFMDKFGRDVVTAETKIGGDPNILSDPQFQPEKKPDYAAIFGTPKAKKKDSPARGRGRRSGKINLPSSPAKKASNVITHPRFLGNDDSEIRILVQKRPIEAKASEHEYECYSCDFKTTRIDVLVYHNKSHVRGGVSQKKTKKTPVKKPRRIKLPVTKTKTIAEDLELLRKGLPIFADENSDTSFDTDKDEESSDDDSTSSEDEPIVVKRKVPQPRSPQKIPKKAKPPPPKPEEKKQDIRSDLLAEWDDDEEEEEVAQLTARLSEPASKEPSKESCFDFVEDEEDLVTNVEGRKIPRVIPPVSERKKSLESVRSRNSTPIKVEEVIESETDKPKETQKDDLDEIEKKKESEFQKEFEAFNNALKETVVPEISDVPPLYKCEQNFHNTRTIKFPDKARRGSATSRNLATKTETENDIKPIETIEKIKEPVKNTEVATKLTNPKKRFAKNFEDETKNSSAKKEESENKESSPKPVVEELKSVELAELKTHVMKKLVDGSSKKEASIKEVDKETKRLRGRAKTSRSIVAEISKVIPSPEVKDSKRSISETADNDTKTDHAKKRKTEVQKVKTEVKHTLKKDEEKKSKSPQLDYSSTSPMKIFSELNIDKDIGTATSLSQSQLLTIENIIGVTSSKKPPKEKEENEKLKKPKDSEPEKSDSTRKKSITEEIETMVKTTQELIRGANEEKIENINTQIFNLTKRLDEAIPEKLPDEIIEAGEDESSQESSGKDSEEKEEEIEDVTEKKVTKLLQDESEEKLEEIRESKEKHENNEHDSESKEKKIEDTSEAKENLVEVIQPKFEEIIDQKSDIEEKSDLKSDSGALIAQESNEDPPEEETTDKVVKQTDKSEDTETTKNDFVKSLFQEEEIVNIEGNLTVVTESDLADKQVEIAAIQEASKPVTLSTFSMDFCDDAETYIKADTIMPEAPKPKPAKITENREKKRPSKDDTKVQDITPDENLKVQIEENKEVPEKIEEITPANEVPPSVIMEGFEDEKDDQLTIDEFSKEKTDIKDDLYKEPVVEKQEVIIPPADISVESEVAKITDSITEQGIKQSSQKLMDILTDKSNMKVTPSTVSTLQVQETKSLTKGKTLTKVTPSTSKANPAIISDKLMKPLNEPKTVSVKKITSKRSYQDVEDIDTYIIQKPKKINVTPEPEVENIKKTPISKGKARILQQTIITPTGDILQPPVGQTQDDNIFDINSMPIVLSDELLTSEGLENMQIVLQESKPKTQLTPIKKPHVAQHQQVKLLNKTPVLPQRSSPSPNIITKQKVPPKVYSNPSTAAKITKHNPSIITQPGKQGKFIIVPASSTATGTKYTVGKRPAIVKKPVQQKMMSSPAKIPETIATGGNKIMILKGQGQQQKILLSSQQQKLTPSKIKGRVLEQQLTQKGANIISQTIVNSKGQVTTLANQSPMSVVRQQQIARNVKIDPIKKRGQQMPQSRLSSELVKPSTSGQRTIIIKNPQGQTVKKIQGTDDAMLDQQVAEQLQAISRAAANQQLRDPAKTSKLQTKRTFVKKDIMAKPTKTQTPTKNVAVPPLAPISPTKKPEEKGEESKRPPHQLVIQDAQGNQTTITEGQILALPSEAIDGQPHSYVLVTLDESGNLTPLNSEALMSLDPNLNLTSDLGNMVLQIDQSAATEAEAKSETPNQESSKEVEKPESENSPAVETGDNNVQAIVSGGEMGQLIITGDAATAQKFLESLAEGNADLANLLANAEGNVLIQADGQQILINADSENPMLVVNPENAESAESGAAFAKKNQDILAAALADTDVFQQQEQSHSKAQLSPSSGALYPMNVTNVLETNSMSSPIMTPLEVPSTNSKKINDENEILTQVPKNVDLPITVTDPNISQTVAQQQVALMATELQSNLELPLAIQDPGLSVTSAEMNSPSFVYSLPTLDDTVEISQKSFSGSISMPLLTEEEESKGKEKSKRSDEKKSDFDGLCAIRGGICNSLSEPPPDMFDFSVTNTMQTGEIDIQIESAPSDKDPEGSVSSGYGAVDVNSPSTTNTDDSCEIPVQPPIVANKPFSEENGTDNKIV